MTTHACTQPGCTGQIVDGYCDICGSPPSLPPPGPNGAPNGGTDVDPFRHLKRASRPLFAARTGDVFSLGLRGELTAAGAGAAMLEVDRVRQYPGGRWLDLDTRTVELTVPLGAAVAPSLGQLTGSTLRALKAPVAVAAFTLKANTTPDAILGTPGALVLGRVAPTP